ncbi:Golgi-associated plant pathogenesis-related protein 1 [Plakobranchus ocellatus]|uniref:Golgi-associated plant pathogenesis-related protein 1 n=1 Tax=Plakobranchus ocellatus TaxID=259542 RepID=A0AAV4B9N8_9GAST|nr:Golgi-associated plant pathogenesis-related protein 1 [Plakobranchus ocellatus]
MGCGSSKDITTNGTTNPDASLEKEKEPEVPKEKSALEKFREESLIAHNHKRSLHGAPPMKLSSELNSIAQSYAEHLAKTGAFEHSARERRKGAGENLAAHSNPINGAAVVDMWYNEIKDYDWSRPEFQPSTGHFTQVIWKESAHLGMGMSEKGSNGMYVFVANYSPAGNMMGAFQDNVLPL